MAISEEKARDHIENWCRRLRTSPQNANWPRFLFHAAHVETAAEILRTGTLRSRSDLPEIGHDVANLPALFNNPIAHSYVRFYFRPKNGYHFRTEGIKCLSDPYRLQFQMSIPIMLVFDAEKILTLDGVRFSQGKLSRTQVEWGSDELFFDTIPYEFVYHDRPIMDPIQREEIHDHRMAEVVFPRRLDLEGRLVRVICRTALDKKTLLHFLGRNDENKNGTIKVEQIHGSTFMHKGLYLTQLTFSDRSLHLKLHHPHRGPASGEYKIRIDRIVDGSVEERYTDKIPLTWSSVEVGPFDNDPESEWHIFLEDCLAYRAPIPSEITEIR